jgi:hypothetical protein
VRIPLLHKILGMAGNQRTRPLRSLQFVGTGGDGTSPRYHARPKYRSRCRFRLRRCGSIDMALRASNSCLSLMISAKFFAFRHAGARRHHSQHIRAERAAWMVGPDVAHTCHFESFRVKLTAVHLPPRENVRANHGIVNRRIRGLTAGKNQAKGSEGEKALQISTTVDKRNLKSTVRQSLGSNRTLSGTL